MNNEIDYKALYEEVKAKLDKIDYNKLKKKINDTLRIKHNRVYGYDRGDQLKRVQENLSLEFICRLDREDVQTFIDEIGYDKLWGIIKELYQEEEEEE